MITRDHTRFRGSHNRDVAAKGIPPPPSQSVSRFVFSIFGLSFFLLTYFSIFSFCFAFFFLFFFFLSLSCSLWHSHAFPISLPPSLPLSLSFTPLRSYSRTLEVDMIRTAPTQIQKTRLPASCSHVERGTCRSQGNGAHAVQT